MLVISRLPNAGDKSAFSIKTPEGREIEVNILSLNQGQVRIGIQADKEVKIQRADIVNTHS
ncbi:carbon storage regulator [Pseudoalteromonas sp. C2R02]|uniref:carbon storage regulator n=1 Tax=Pseudoalteromonas sp. C2R02 TaxID=2841565 RepID=UPI001C0905F7|nr:carbon storage regulator [Pseudoalteromonas sp. C2R02]MBU2968728.1 carbon storage regulator [Pseudoalteromonas sp. C2R02]